MGIRDESLCKVPDHHRTGSCEQVFSGPQELIRYRFAQFLAHLLHIGRPATYKTCKHAPRVD